MRQPVVVSGFMNEQYHQCPHRSEVGREHERGEPRIVRP
jgi:hypothetical protein